MILKKVHHFKKKFIISKKVHHLKKVIVSRKVHNFKKKFIISKKVHNYFFLLIKEFVSRWGRASYGGFNKNLERLAEKMNAKEDEEDAEMGEDIDAEEVNRRLKLIRSGNYKPENDNPDSDGGNDEAPKKRIKIEDQEPECDTLHFKRPT